MRVQWSSFALRQAEEIVLRIAEDRPAAAVRWLDGLFERVTSLRELPEQGRSIPEARRADLRELIYGSYRIIYRVRHDAVAVLIVRHSRMHLDPDDLPGLP